MSPLHTLRPRGTPTSASLQSQWSNPSDILSLLLLIGGDIIRSALAQQAGDWLPTPVVFSFGWVAYSFTALSSAISNDRLMPPTPDISVVVSSTEFGHVRSNQSWILGRLLRDFEKFWMPLEVRQNLANMLTQAGKPKAGLCISIFEASSDAEAGIPKRDLYWYSGYLVAIIQLGIAVVPWVIWGQWEIFLITTAGTLLAFAVGSLPQWREERWKCRRGTKKTFTLCRGNGSQHVLVILGGGRGLDLEDLAVSDEAASPLRMTTLVLLSFAICWIVLLITVSGIKEHTWFLVAVGTLGMIHTTLVTGAPRRPEWFGIHLKFREVFVRRKVMEALKVAEEKYPTLGKSLLPTFFPNGVRAEDGEWASRGIKS